MGANDGPHGPVRAVIERSTEFKGLVRASGAVGSSSPPPEERNENESKRYRP